MPTCAMVFAAGLGKRMQPITLTTPKPLVKVAGKCLLDYTLDNLKAAGITHVVVNAHHLHEQVEAHLNTRSDLHITCLYEPLLLETGGGLANALPHLTGDAFFVINSDIIWQDKNGSDLLAKLASRYAETRPTSVITLVERSRAIGYHGAGDFDTDAEGHVYRLSNQTEHSHIFAGIQLLTRSAVAHFKPEPFSLNVLFKQALQTDGQLNAIVGHNFDGLFLHVGTPADIAVAESHLA